MNCYDFDKTIYNGDSTKDFYLFCLKRHKGIIKTFPGLIKAFTKFYVLKKGNKTDFKEKMYSLCDKFCRALGHKIGIHYNKNDDIDYDEMEMYANKINRNYAYKDKSDDFEIGR